MHDTATGKAARLAQEAEHLSCDLVRLLANAA